MNDNSARIAAYNDYYKQGKDSLSQGDIERAKELFLNAASVANEIANNSSSPKVIEEYHNLAKKLLIYVRSNCVSKPSKPVAAAEDDVDVPVFKPYEGDKITFKEVAGLQDVKDQVIFRVLEPLRNPDYAKRFGINPGAKIVLYGPPGTGKTLIARAIAGEVDAAFYPIKCDDLISKYMGDSGKTLHTLFEDAQKNKRAIIFFDEFDAVASKREDGSGSVDAEMARFVATFLTEVDGFKKSKDCEMLLLIAATNRPWALDPAMTRGGRFDNLIYVTLPDYQSRLFQFRKNLSGAAVDQNLSFELMAEETQGFGGGDIFAMCEDMKVMAYRRGVKNGYKQDESIVWADFKESAKGRRASATEEDLEKFENFKNKIC